MTATKRSCTARTRCGSYCRQTYATGRGCASEALPEHPRRDALAREGFQLLVTEQDTTGRAPEWNHLTEDDREKWRDNADAWAKVLADDANKQIAARRAESETDRLFDRSRTVFRAPPVDQHSDWFRRDDTGVTSSPGLAAFVSPPSDPRQNLRDVLDRLSEGRRYYTVADDGTVTRRWGTPPAPPAGIRSGVARDTRVLTPHIIGGYAGHSVSYPRTVNGLPAREAECVCDDPMPLPAYNPDHPDYDDHRTIPVDAWLRCLACHGLYAR